MKKKKLKQLQLNKRIVINLNKDLFFGGYRTNLTQNCPNSWVCPVETMVEDSCHHPTLHQNCHTLGAECESVIC